MSEMIHWTEAINGGVNDGTPHYNRMVRRIAGRDLSGPSTLWHGTNCAEMYLGRFWAIRADDEETLYLDWLDNGRWHGYSGMSRPILGTFWQRLRAAAGTLFIFGFKPGEALPSFDSEDNHTTGQHPVDPVTGKPLSTDPQGPQDGAQSTYDTPICALADGLTLRDAAFPFFIRRATVTPGDGLFLAARGDTEGIGPANRVIEINTENGGRTRICSFWNEEESAFQMSTTDFQSLGGDPTKLPAYFAWRPQSGTNAGGKWLAVETAPTTGHWLETQTTPGNIRFVARPSGTLPYDVTLWNRLCFDILADGSIDTEGGPLIEPTCENASCALESLPEGTRFRIIRRPVHDSANPITSLQITDPSTTKRLSTTRDLYPTLWLRTDSTAPLNDLTTYTKLVNFARLLPLETEAQTTIEVALLIPPTNAPLKVNELPHLTRRS